MVYVVNLTRVAGKKPHDYTVHSHCSALTPRGPKVTGSVPPAVAAPFCCAQLCVVPVIDMVVQPLDRRISLLKMTSLVSRYSKAGNAAGRTYACLLYSQRRCLEAVSKSIGALSRVEGATTRDSSIIPANPLNQQRPPKTHLQRPIPAV